MRWILRIVVGFLALVGVGAAVFHYSVPPYNPGFIQFPRITALHVILGACYLALAPLQFIKGIRTRWPGYHRWMGRALVLMGAVVGSTALFMGVVFPAAGWVEGIVISIFGTLFLVALLLGFLHVRAGRIALHREWMGRALAVGLAIATTRLIAIPAIIIMGEGSNGLLVVLLPFAAAFVLHGLLAELWIRHTRRPDKGAPSVAAPAWQTASTGYRIRSYEEEPKP